MKIFGKVQGVWFRASAAKVAKSLNLKGFAKNLPDGSVEIIAVGQRNDLEQLRAWAEVGPTGARVEKIEESWSKTEADFKDFKIL